MQPTFEAGLDGVVFSSAGCKLLGGFYRGAGAGPRPTAVLLHGMPGVEKNLDVAYRLRDLGWNCLYFHPRGSWGSEGAYDVPGHVDDTRAAVDWVLGHAAVDPSRVALVGASMGGYAVLRLAAADVRVRATVAISPFVDRDAFPLPPELAEEFAAMLHGVTASDLLRQWETLPNAAELAPALADRPLLLLTADRDELFPPSHYDELVRRLPHLTWVRRVDADHGFSGCRPWLVETVCDWLVSSFSADASAATRSMIGRA
jgi:pimeloyl-ACP methyl ester carboxylesterase